MRTNKIRVKHEIKLERYNAGLATVIKEAVGAPAKADVLVGDEGVRVIWWQQKKI